MKNKEDTSENYQQSPLKSPGFPSKQQIGKKVSVHLGWGGDWETADDSQEERGTVPKQDQGFMNKGEVEENNFLQTLHEKGRTWLMTNQE